MTTAQLLWSSTAIEKYLSTVIIEWRVGYLVRINLNTKYYYFHCGMNDNDS